MILHNLMETKLNFTENDSLIADYILAHGEDVLSMRSDELGKASYTSSAAVIRFCHTLGLSGFREFKIRYARELEQNLQKKITVNPNFPFSFHDSSADIAAQLKNVVSEAVQQTQNILLADKPKLEKAVSKLMSAEKTGIFGSGDAYIAGMAFQAQMMRAGFNYLITPIYGEQGHLIQTFDHKDTALVLSYSGTTEKTIEAAVSLKKRGTFCIALTSNRQSELARIVDIPLFLPDAERKFHRLGNFSSQASMTYVLNVLYSIIYVRTYRSSEKNID